MNPLLLYLLLVKATLTSFSGMGGLPIVREEFVVQRRLLTDRQLSTAVAVGRAVPGPNGLYLVATGYFVAGIPGAAAGCAALMTPAFLVIPLLIRLGRHRDNRRVRGAIRAVTLAAGGALRDRPDGPRRMDRRAAGRNLGREFRRADLDRTGHTLGSTTRRRSGARGSLVVVSYLVMPNWRLGDDLDDYCIKCKRLTNHAIVSLVGEEAGKVRCRSCYSEHDFRHEIVPPSKKELKKAADAAAAAAAEAAEAAKTE